MRDTEFYPFQSLEKANDLAEAVRFLCPSAATIKKVNTMLSEWLDSATFACSHGALLSFLMYRGASENGNLGNRLVKCDGKA